MPKQQRSKPSWGLVAQKGLLIMRALRLSRTSLRKHWAVTGLVILLAGMAIGCGGGAAPATVVLTPTEVPVATPVPNGETLAREQGCLGCHTTDGRELIGPTWKGLFGKEEKLDDGTTVTVDDAYLRESILDPNAKIVATFVGDLMPGNFRDRLSDQQIEAIIEYIKTVR